MSALFVAMLLTITVAFTQWIAPITPKLPRSCRSSAVGVYNDSIFIIGGYDGGYRQLVEYRIVDDEMVDHGQNYLTDGTYGSAQYYSQIENKVFMIWPNQNSKINVFLLESKTFIHGYQNITIPVTVYDQACLASIANRLFVVGGWNHSFLADVQVFDLFSMKWLDNVPSMQRVRGDHCCIVAPNTLNLYAIGGYSYSNTIEIIQTDDIINNQWEYIDDVLSVTARATRCVFNGHSNEIWVVGGDTVINGSGYILDTVHIINTITNNVSLLDQSLIIPVRYTAPIIANNMLYAFAGFNGSLLDSWQKYELYSLAPTKAPTPSPTAFPTSQPTRNPTIDPTIDPTSNPTSYPTTNPTQIPTLNPTQIPTNPTSDPSIHPTNVPTANPNKSPTSDPTQLTTTKSTSYPSKTPTNAVKPVDCEDCRFKEGLYCWSGTQPYNANEDSDWCEPCPVHTAGTNGICNECRGMTEPNHNKDDCIDSDLNEYIGEIISALIGAMIAIICAALGICYRHTIQQKLCPKTTTNETEHRTKDTTPKSNDIADKSISLLANTTMQIQMAESTK